MSVTTTRSYTSDSTSLTPTHQVKESLRLIEDLKFFLATAPANWQENQVIRRYYLNHDEGFVSCVYWNNLYFITGTDIVRCIVYKFEHFGRKIIDRKKFEEGIFSDLRNLKCGTDAILEPPRSEFLEFLFKNSCLRTQKKQKVFFWFNVPHDKLMADALERDLKKEKLGQNPTTISHREPALSFDYDESSSLYTQLSKHMETSKKVNDAATAGISANGTVGATAGSTATTATTTTNGATSHGISTGDDNESNKQSNGSEKSSPEYTTTARGREDYGFLNEATPAQYKTSSDYEDDFPLDYINHSGGQNPEDYITLDPNYQPGAYASIIDDNYDSFLDATLFMPPSLVQAAPTTATAATTTNQVAFNDEYLIEQAQPLRTPLPPISSGPLQPKSAAKFFSIQGNEEAFFPQGYQTLTSTGQQLVPPISAKYQSQFTARQVATPTYLKAIPQPPQQYYDQQSGQLYQATTEIPISYNVVHPDSEYWTNNPNVQTAATTAPMYDANGFPIPINQSYMIHNDHPEMMPAYNMVVPQLQQQPQQILQQPPTPQFQQGRQLQGILKNSLKNAKKRLGQQSLPNSKLGGGVGKRSNEKGNLYSGSLNDVVSSKVTKVINKDDIK
ncbi:Transcription factor CPH1 [Candida viswanathii]|uniref:Transcription factor CPH1 n=1 Tax=Candida viswanathii TaxID=5486 RepID=A0A367XS89_9ASCO|nr:Transcription factor CPH1 [Candida viswanathii]